MNPKKLALSISFIFLCIFFSLSSFAECYSYMDCKPLPKFLTKYTKNLSCKYETYYKKGNILVLVSECEIIVIDLLKNKKYFIYDEEGKIYSQNHFDTAPGLQNIRILSKNEIILDARFYCEEAVRIRFSSNRYKIYSRKKISKCEG